jgi:glycosyltransferase involved in cell wall biosynthesis
MAIFSFVVSDLYGGGAQRVLLNTANALQQRGHDVTVYILRDKIEHSVPEGLRIVNLKAINRLTKLFRSRIIEKWQARKIEQALSAVPSDVVISCSCDRITRHIAGHDVFYWVHIHLTGAVKNEAQRQTVIRRWSKIYTDKKVIAVSEGIAKDLAENIGLDRKNIRVIPNPIDRAVLTQRASELTPMTDNLPGEFFIHVGRLEPRKRHDWLLQAFAGSNVSSHLVLVGDGCSQDFKRVRRLAEEYRVADRTHILGFVQNPYPVIRRAKALVLTSEREGLPTVLIESLMLDVPCVSFDCPSGPREIMEGWLDEWLLPLGDEESLALALKRLEYRTPIVPRAAAERFLPENVVKEFEKLMVS